MTVYEIQNILSQYGLYVLAALVFVEYLSFPGMPRGIVLPVMGFVSRLGVFSFEYAFISALAAAMAASLLIYLIGYALPEPAMKFYSRREKYADRFREVEKFMKKYGRLALLRSRLTRTYRTFISIPAGILRMNFLGYFVSSLIGNALFIVASIGVVNLLTMFIV